MTMLNDYVELVQRATQNNDHTGAIILMAQYAAKKHSQLEGVYALVKSAYAVETLHGFYGHMPAYLNQIRDEVGDRIESFLSADEKQAFDNVR